MRAVRTVLSNLRDVRHMGFFYLKHHVSTSASVRGIGRVTVRRGSDAEVFSQVFSSMQYELQFVRQFDEIRRRFEEIEAFGKIPLIIDLGANNGASALWFALAFRAHASWPSSLIPRTQQRVASMFKDRTSLSSKRRSAATSAWSTSSLITAKTGPLRRNEVLVEQFSCSRCPKFLTVTVIANSLW